MDELAPIRFFTNVFILHDLRHCFDQHIKPLHVDTENFKQKSKFDPLYDNKYDPFDICSITFLLPYFAHHSCRNQFDSGTVKAILLKLFHFRVGSYYSESLVEYESRWVKGVYCMTKNYITGLYDLEIKSCYPISTKDYEHVLYHPDFHDSNFASSFDYVDFCRQYYALKEATKYDFF